MSEQESKDTEEKAAQELAPIAARALTRRYVLALGAVAVLVIEIGRASCRERV